MKASILGQMKQVSPLGMQKLVNPDGGPTKKKSFLFSLNLTTLIDAFCILVIFLLSNMNGRVQNIQNKDKLILPTALRTDALEGGLVIRIENKNIFINDKPVATENVTKALLAEKKNESSSLVIQADRAAEYENIAVVLRAGGVAGYEKYVFAVLPGT